MILNGKKLAVTGGCGFVGQHLVRSLAEGNKVVVIDRARKELPEGCEFFELDLKSIPDLEKAISGCDMVFHLAANPRVSEMTDRPDSAIEDNIRTTFNVLEAMRRQGVRSFMLASTSAAYGIPKKMPVRESYGPLEPLSLYGASKIGCEALASAYAHSFNMNAWIFRFANIVGGGAGYGVIPDFVRKLKENSAKLQILGNGKQERAFLHAEDCVGGVRFAVEHAEDSEGPEGRVHLYNIGPGDVISIREVARIVSEEMGLSPKLEFTGGKGGWKGDIPKLSISIDKARKLGWTPKHTSESAVRSAARALLGG